MNLAISVAIVVQGSFTYGICRVVLIQIEIVLFELDRVRRRLKNVKIQLNENLED
jgi:hypothetical protein